MTRMNWVGCKVKAKFPGYGKTKWEGVCIAGPNESQPKWTVSYTVPEEIEWHHTEKQMQKMEKEWPENIDNEPRAPPRQCILCAESVENQDGELLPSILHCDNNSDHYCHLACAGYKAIPPGLWLCRLCAKPTTDFEEEDGFRETVQQDEDSQENTIQHESTSKESSGIKRHRAESHSDQDEDEEEVPKRARCQAVGLAALEYALNPAKEFTGTTWPEYALWVHGVLWFLVKRIQEKVLQVSNEAQGLAGRQAFAVDTDVFPKRKAVAAYATCLFRTIANGIERPLPPNDLDNEAIEHIAQDLDTDFKDIINNNLILKGTVLDDDINRKKMTTEAARRWLRQCGEFRVDLSLIQNLQVAALSQSVPTVPEIIVEDHLTPTYSPTTAELLPLPMKTSTNSNMVALRSGEIFVVLREDVLNRLRARFSTYWQWESDAEIIDRVPDLFDNVQHKNIEAKSSTRMIPLKQQSAYHTPEEFRRQTIERKRCQRKEKAFLESSFCMLLPYHDLVQGDAGQHGVLPKPVFDVLRHWGCSGEGFATPFNATLDAFFSPFQQADTFFGSRGSFFRASFYQGNYEINPPFTVNDNRVVQAMASALHEAEINHRALSFVLIHTENYMRQVKKNTLFQRFIVHHMYMTKGEHYYYEGAFFQKSKPRAYIPTLDSLIVFAMTKAARAQWPVTDSFLHDFKTAFKWPIESPGLYFHSYSLCPPLITPLSLRPPPPSSATAFGTQQKQNDAEKEDDSIQEENDEKKKEHFQEHNRKVSPSSIVSRPQLRTISL